LIFCLYSPKFLLNDKSLNNAFHGIFLHFIYINNFNLVKNTALSRLI
jgi:hypothetical protein